MLGLEATEGSDRVVNKAETARLATTETSGDAVDDDASLIGNFIHLGEHVADLLLLDADGSLVEDLNELQNASMTSGMREGRKKKAKYELLALQEGVREELVRADGSRHC